MFRPDPVAFASLAARALALGAPAASAAAPPRGAGLPAGIEQLDSRGGITEYRLRSNGMKILLSPNHAAPVITFMAVYHVGSRNETPGNTGSAHLLEHLLFNKSTQSFGKANGKPTFQEVLAEAGADFGSTNMTTWFDRMTSYSTLPSDRLDLAMKIEADRLGRALLLDSERQPEMSVVRNEYEIGENDPGQALDKAVIGAAIVAHPYHWSTIGYRSDIEGVSTVKLREHYEDFFHPDNATAILVGDFDTAKALAMFAREFGAFPRSKRPIPQVITVEPPQEGERRVVVRRPGQVGLVQLAYMRPGSMHPDYIPLDVLQAIVGNGVNARLHQALVETKLATTVAAENLWMRDPYPFVVYATVAPGVEHRKVEDAIKAVLYEVAENGVTGDEVARAKSQLEVSVIRSRDGTYPFASSLGEAVASADWKWFVNYTDVLQRVTPEDVHGVASAYLAPDRATVGWFVPVRDGEATAAAAGERGKAGATGDAAAGARAPAAVSSGGSPSAGAPANPGSGAAVAKSSSPAADARSFAERTVRRELANGIVLDVVVNRAVPTVALQGIVLAGQMAAPSGKPAVPQLTAMMLNRGTRTASKEAIAARLDAVGAQVDVSSGPYHATLAANGQARDLPLLLETLADALQSPAFAEDELAKAKLEMQAGVLRAHDDTRQRAMDRATQLVFAEGHPYRAPGKDAMTAGIDKASAADLRAFHRERYVGAGTVVAIVGDVDPDAVVAEFEKRFGGITRGAKPVYEVERTAAGEPSREVIPMPGKANLDLVYAHASGLARNDPEYDAALIANAVLGQSALTARLGKRIRDTEGLSYTMWSRFLMSDAIDGLWLTDIRLAPQNLAKAMQSAHEVMAEYERTGPTDAEIEAQKSFFAGNFQVQLGTNAGVATALATAEKFGFSPGYLDEYPARVRAVTREQVVSAMRKYLHPDRGVVIAAGDIETLPQ
jgi:zinc protease